MSQKKGLVILCCMVKNERERETRSEWLVVWAVFMFGFLFSPGFCGVVSSVDLIGQNIVG